MDRISLIDEITALEWEQFSAVQNEGGTAPCQRDPETFDIMRRSQLMAWDGPLLQSYRRDLLRAKAAHHNLMTEKYARMMQSTAPESYTLIEAQLPSLTETHKKLVESLIAPQLKWMEEYAKKYPKLAGKNRKIYTADDTPYATSYETYLRGELSVYSDETLRLYQKFMQRLAENGINLTLQIMENTVKMYGYSSLAQAEANQ